jgi:hypothetical protein
MIDLSTYIEMYAAATTQKERAEIEAAVTEDFLKAGQACGVRYVHVATALGSTNVYDTCARIKLARLSVPPPWDVVERYESMQTAYEVFTVSGRDALTRYLDLPPFDTMRAHLRGRPSEAGTRRPRRDSRNGAALGGNGAVPNAESVVEELQRLVDTKPPVKRAPKVIDIRWTSLRKLIMTRFGKKFPPGLAKKFDGDLAVLFEGWRHEIRNYQQRKDSGYEMPDLSRLRVGGADRKKLVDACQLYAIDPPRDGKPLDMSAARRARRTLSRLYHPDTNGGDTSLLEKFHEVNEAYRLIEQYNESIQGD